MSEASRDDVRAVEGVEEGPDEPADSSHSTFIVDDEFRYPLLKGTVLNLNLRPNVAPVDTLVVVTHGLTMRLILMQLFGWSPNTFHTIWNAGNCDCYVLRKDEGVPGRSPFVLCRESGDTPRSSRLLRVRFADGSVRQLALDDYLSLASPRGRQTEAAKRMLAAQHGLDPRTIASIDFYGPASQVHEGAELSDVVGVVVEAGEHGLVPTAATSE